MLRYLNIYLDSIIFGHCTNDIFLASQTGQSWIDDWCVRNCAATPPNCPATHCICDTVTTATAATTEAPFVPAQGSSAAGSIQQDPVQRPVQIGQASGPVQCRPSLTYAGTCDHLTV